ncbi:hypothetical protein EU523_00160 [Candidatus Heimdallarchaeota archaeon]|nr:MAG: hypothetical protein EU523_00160 [Candidatus Heimdallarchaeota archaeon]
MLGLSQAGKTSIRQIIFEGFTPVATALNPATVRINRKIFNLAGGNINLFDIGGQTNYLNEIFQIYKNRTFSDVKAVIFVVDVSDAGNIMRSNYYFGLTLQALSQISKNARIFIFAHKMDLVPFDKKEAVIKSIADIFKTDQYPQVDIQGTSIFDESIWDAMQQVLSFAYPRDQAKTIEIKTTISKYGLNSLTISTSQGLVLYSEPEVNIGINFTRIKNDLTKTYFSGKILHQAMFSLTDHFVFMKEIEDDLVITSVFPAEQKISKYQDNFNKLVERIRGLFKPDELLGKAKFKMKQTLSEFLTTKGLKNVQGLERRFDKKISVRCDVCGKQIQKSILEVALDNSEQLERGIKISSGLGTTTVEIYPQHDCIKGIREIPITLDNNLEYRRYDKSRPI